MACDECDQWTHAKCLGITNSIYNDLANSSVAWYCTTCKQPNHSLVPYESSKSHSSDTSILQAGNSSSLDSSLGSIGSPTATSSPKKSQAKQHTNNNTGLRKLVINFQSIRNKVNELEVLIDTTKPDIIIGTETWTNSDVSSSELFPETYMVYRRDRGTDNHGGVLIAVRNNLTSTEIYKSTSCELICIKIDLPNKRSMIVGAFYRPPGTDESYLRSFISEVTELKHAYEKSIFYIGGDFNLPDVDWATSSIQGSQYPTTLNEAIISMSEDLGLCQMVDFKTRGDNTLDLVFTSHPSLVDRQRQSQPSEKQTMT